MPPKGRTKHKPTGSSNNKANCDRDIKTNITPVIMKPETPDVIKDINSVQEIVL